MTAQPIIRSLGQVAIRAQELERAVSFYRDILGLPYIWSDGQLAFFQCGSVRLLLERPEAPEFDHPSSILYLDVEDIDHAVSDLTARGVTFTVPPHHVGNLGDVAVWMAFFRDSEGNTLALQCERHL